MVSIIVGQKGKIMADIFGTKDLGVEDTSSLKTGDTRKKYGAKCPSGYKKDKNGKCVKK